MEKIIERFEQYSPKRGALYLHSSQITNEILLDIQDRIELLPNLVNIDLSYNPLTCVPNFNLPNLEMLWLSGCLLTSIPDFDMLRNLTRLDLDHNKLTIIPNFNLPKLKVLWLQHNKLTSIPNLDAPDLLDLMLSYNEITHLPPLYVPNLRVLDIYCNPLDKDFEFPNSVYKSYSGDALKLRISKEHVEFIRYYIERKVTISVLREYDVIFSDKTDEIQLRNEGNTLRTHAKSARFC